MTFDTFRTLFGTTLTNPRQGGREVIDLNLPTRGLWIALMLMAVVLSLLVSGLFHVSPMPPDELGQMIRMSPAFQAPLIFAVINWGQSGITVFVLHWISQMVGGDGRSPGRGMTTRRSGRRASRVSSWADETTSETLFVRHHLAIALASDRAVTRSSTAANSSTKSTQSGVQRSMAAAIVRRACWPVLSAPAARGKRDASAMPAALSSRSAPWRSLPT